MNTNRVAFLSAFAVATALASAAQAGGGVRLDFGVPLGSFVAKPANGGGSYNAPKAKKPPVMQALRKPQKPAERVAKVDPKPDVEEVAVAKSPKPSADNTPEIVAATGNSALIQGSIPADAPASDKTAEAETEAPAETTVTAHTNPVSNESESCKKFIPAVGMTVSVGCE